MMHLILHGMRGIEHRMLIQYIGHNLSYMGFDLFLMVIFKRIFRVDANMIAVTVCSEI
jgi:hypothetical protein